MKNKSLSPRKRGDDLILKQIFGKTKAKPKGFFGKIAYGVKAGLQKTLSFVKQLNPIYSIGIVIAAVFILQLIIPQDVLWPWDQTKAASGFSGVWQQDDWAGGAGQGTTTEEEGSDKYSLDDGRISVTDNFSGKAGFAAYPNRTDINQGNESENPTVAADASGRTVTVWTDKSMNNKRRLFARLADKDGRALPLGAGTDERLDGITNDSKRATFSRPIVVFEPVTNQFLVTWSHKIGHQEGKANVYLRVLKIDEGSILKTINSSPISIAGDNDLIQRNPHIAVRYHFSSEASGKSQNDIIITWQEESGSIVGDIDVKAVGYKISTGSLERSSSGVLRIDQKGTHKSEDSAHSTEPQAAIATNSSVMFTWTDDRAEDQNKDIYGRKFTVSEFWPEAPK